VKDRKRKKENMAKYRMSKAIGIDLGTTNSVVAIMNPTDTAIIVHRDAKTKVATTPSCIWKDPENNQIIVGPKAYSRIGTTPEPVQSIKRSMGMQKTAELTDERVTPEEVSAHILREMKRQIEEDVARLNTPSTTWVVDRAIITVPAYFDQPQIEATRKAAELAGLQVLELLHEPTAAACYYCWETNTQNGTFLVYDLGGGTFDVSIVRCTEGEFEVLGISGNNRLGGDDIDTLFAEELQHRLDLQFDLKDQEDELRFKKLKNLAEVVKIVLSTATEHTLRDSIRLQDKAGERININVDLEREELEQLITPLIERTLAYCTEALDKAYQKANVTLADIDQVILAGGSTHIPLVREIVKKTFCADQLAQGLRAKCAEPVYKKVEQLVGLGAAVRAAAIGGLTVDNPEKSVRITFRGISATDMKQISIGGTVEALTPAINVANGKICLAHSDLNYQDEQEIKGNGAFAFRRVPLQSATENHLTFEVYDQHGILIATIERSLYQSKQELPPTGGSTGTAILSKAIKMGVVYQDVGRDYEQPKVLFSEGTTLPAHCKGTFYYRKDANYIRLPLYQGEKVIKEIRIEVESPVEKGTEIPLVFEVDVLATITVKGQVAKTVFAVTVEAAPPRKSPTPEDVQMLKKNFNTAVVLLPIEKRSTTLAQYRRVLQGYESAVKRDDREQAIHEFEEMLGIVSSISQGSTALEPPKETFEALVAECLVLYRHAMLHSSNLKQSDDYRKMAQEIKTQQAKGENAFAANDQSTYTEAIGIVESIRDYLSALIWQAQRATETRTETQKWTDYILYILQEIRILDQSTNLQVNRAVSDQLIAIRQELENALEEVRSNLPIAMSKTQKASVALEKVKTLLNVAVDMNARGLVEDRGDLLP
jgi:molecular chaperone DnaK